MHHTLDIHPIPDKPHIFVNELDLIDPNKFETTREMKKALEEPDACTVRAYVPLDLSRDDILRRLDELDKPDRYKRSSWYCSSFQSRVEQIIKQLEIYDQIKAVRNMPATIETNPDDPGHRHSPEGIEVATEIVSRLEAYEESLDGMLDELKEEFGLV